MSDGQQVEVVFEPQPEGGFTVYSPDLPGMVTEGDTLDQATANAREAIELYVESMRERGKQVPLGVVRRNSPFLRELAPAARDLGRSGHQGP